MSDRDEPMTSFELLRLPTYIELPNEDSMTRRKKEKKQH